MRFADIRRPLYIGYRACNLQDTIIRPSGEAEFSHSEFEQLVTFGIQGAIGTHHLRGHHRITMDEAAMAETFVLDSAGFEYPLAHRCRRLARSGIPQLVIRHGLYFTLDIHAHELFMCRLFCSDYHLCNRSLLNFFSLLFGRERTCVPILHTKSATKLQKKYQKIKKKIGFLRIFFRMLIFERIIPNSTKMQK